MACAGIVTDSWCYYLAVAERAPSINPFATADLAEEEGTVCAPATNPAPVALFGVSDKHDVTDATNNAIKKYRMSFLRRYLDRMYTKLLVMPLFGFAASLTQYADSHCHEWNN